MVDFTVGTMADLVGFEGYVRLCWRPRHIAHDIAMADF